MDPRFHFRVLREVRLIFHDAQSVQLALAAAPRVRRMREPQGRRRLTAYSARHVVIGRRRRRCRGGDEQHRRTAAIVRSSTLARIEPKIVTSHLRVLVEEFAEASRVLRSNLCGHLIPPLMISTLYPRVERV